MFWPLLRLWHKPLSLSHVAQAKQRSEKCIAGEGIQHGLLRLEQDGRRVRGHRGAKLPRRNANLNTYTRPVASQPARANLRHTTPLQALTCSLPLPKKTVSTAVNHRGFFVTFRDGRPPQRRTRRTARRAS